MVKKIKFTVDNDGQVSISVEGAVGSECDAMTAPFEEALGTISKKERKDAYYLTQQEENDLKVEGI